jgi:hypothetical protein
MAIETQASHKRVVEARADCGFASAKIAAGIVFFERSCADGYTVDFNFRAGRSAGDAELFCMAGEREKGERYERDGARAAERTGESEDTFPGWMLAQMGVYHELVYRYGNKWFVSEEMMERIIRLGKLRPGVLRP